MQKLSHLLSRPLLQAGDIDWSFEDKFWEQFLLRVRLLLFGDLLLEVRYLMVFVSRSCLFHQRFARLRFLGELQQQRINFDCIFLVVFCWGGQVTFSFNPVGFLGLIKPVYFFVRFQPWNVAHQQLLLLRLQQERLLLQQGSFALEETGLQREIYWGHGRWVIHLIEFEVVLEKSGGFRLKHLLHELQLVGVLVLVFRFQLLEAFSTGICIEKFGRILPDIVGVGFELLPDHLPLLLHRFGYATDLLEHWSPNTIDAVLLCLVNEVDHVSQRLILLKLLHFDQIALHQIVNEDLNFILVIGSFVKLCEFSQ